MCDDESMGASPTRNPARQSAPRVSAGPLTPADWLRAIVQAIGDQALTLGEIQQAVGELIVTPQTAAVEEYVEVLLQEGVLVDAAHNQHFALTDDGRTLLEGVLASPSS